MTDAQNNPAPGEGDNSFAGGVGDDLPGNLDDAVTDLDRIEMPDDLLDHVPDDDPSGPAGPDREDSVQDPDDALAQRVESIDKELGESFGTRIACASGEAASCAM